MAQECEPRCPPGFFQFPGKSPDGRESDWFIVPKDGFLGHVRSRSNRNKQLEGFIVPGTIQNPIGIWEGLERLDGKKSALAYVAIGSRFQSDILIELPPQPNKVFTVYVRESRAVGGQLIVDYWEHLPEDGKNPGFPEYHRARYGRRLWPPEEPPNSSNS